MPVPVIAPGLIVQIPVAGNPVSITLPVAVEQVGWVMAPIAGGAGIFSTASVIWFEMAGLPETQVSLEVIVTAIISPLTGMYEYVKVLVPAFTPLTFH